MSVGDLRIVGGDWRESSGGRTAGAPSLSARAEHGAPDALALRLLRRAAISTALPSPKEEAQALTVL